MSLLGGQFVILVELNGMQLKTKYHAWRTPRASNARVDIPRGVYGVAEQRCLLNAG